MHVSKVVIKQHAIDVLKTVVFPKVVVGLLPGLHGNSCECIVMNAQAQSLQRW